MLGRVPCRQLQFLGCSLMAGALLTGCQTPVDEESFSNSFDAQKVAQLSHEAYKVAFDATFWAHHDLKIAAFQPTGLDYEVVYYLDDITQRVPWIGRTAEKHPTTARVSSKASYDMVAYDGMMLQHRYQRSSFRPSTDAKIERLLRLLDEIGALYTQKPEAGKGGTQRHAEDVEGTNAAPTHQ